MPLRAREIYYFVRVGNYASRPLRQLEADFGRLGRVGQAAAQQLRSLEAEQQRLNKTIAARQRVISGLQIGADPRVRSFVREQNRLAAAQNAITTKRVQLNRLALTQQQELNAALARTDDLEARRARLIESQNVARSTQLANIRSQQARITELTNAEKVAAANQAITRDIAAQTLAIQKQRAREFHQVLTPQQMTAARAGRFSSMPDVAKVQRQYAAAEVAVLRAQKAFNEAKLGSDGLTKAQNRTAAATSKLAAMQSEAAVKEGTYADAVNRADAAIQKNRTQIARLSTVYEENQAAIAGLIEKEGALNAAQSATLQKRFAIAAALRNEVALLEADNAALATNTAAQARLTRQINVRSRWEAVSRGSRILTDLGRTAQFTGGIVVAALGFMAHAAANFQTQVALTATQVGNNLGQVHQQTTRIMRGIITQMHDFPAAADEMAKASYDIFSSLQFQGNQAQKTAQGLRVLRLANMAAVGGQASLVDTTRAAITILNDFGKAGRGAATDISQLHHFLNVAFAAVRFGRMTFEEFTQSLTSAAPAAKAAHQSFEDMAGTLAFLTTRIPSVRTAAISYARLLEIIQRAGPGLRRHGVEIKDATGRMKPLQLIISDIANKFPNLAKGTRFVTNFFKDITKGTGAGTMGTIQARRAFVFLVQQTNQYLALLHKVRVDPREFAKSFDDLRQTAGVRWKLFLNQLRALTLQVGASVIPILMRILGPIRDATKWFDNLSEAEKRHITTTTTWVAAITVIAGSIAIVIGSLGRMTAAFGLTNRLWLAQITTIGLVVYALVHFGQASNAARAALNAWTRDGATFVAGLALITLAVVRLRAALVTLAGTRAAQMVTGLFTAAAVGNSAAMLSNVTALGARLGPLVLVVGAIAGGLLLWRNHLNNMRHIQDQINREFEQMRAMTRRPLVFAIQFGRIGGTVRDIEKARNAIQTIREDIKTARAEGASRTRLRGLTLELADAEDVLAAARYRSNRAFRSFSASLAASGRDSRAIRDMKERLVQLRNLRRELQTAIHDPTARGQEASRRATALSRQLGIAESPAAIQRAIGLTTRNIQTARQQMRQGIVRLRREFVQQVRSIGRTEGIRGISPGILRDMFNVALRRGRMLTIPQIRAFVRAELDPRFRQKVPKDVRAAINAGLRQRFIIRYQLRHPEQQIQAAFHHREAIEPLTRAVESQAQRRAARIALIFQKVVTQAQLGDVGTRAAKVGAAISLGMADGVYHNRRKVYDAVIEVAIAALKQGATAIGASSPSRRAAQEIGLPFVQGIAQGISKNKVKAIRAASQVALSLFSGPVISALKKGQAITQKTLQLDLRAQTKQLIQFSQALQTLNERNAPRGLLAQLAELGPEQAGNIAKLAKMSDPELRKYIKTWEYATSIVNDLIDKHKKKVDELPQAVQNARQEIQQIFQNLTSEYQNLLQQNQQAFGQLFQGPYMQSPGFQAMQEWGLKARPVDALKDIRSQVAQFRRWNRELRQLQRRGAPRELIRQLRELGPEAEPQVRLLLQMPRRMWAQYVRAFNQGQKLVRQQTMRDLRAYIATYREFGKQMAHAIALGLESGSKAIRQTIKKMIYELFPQLAKTAREPHPGRHPGRHTPAPKRGTQATRTTQIHQDNRVTVHADKQDVSTALRKARHYQRTRHPHTTTRP